MPTPRAHPAPAVCQNALGPAVRIAAQSITRRRKPLIATAPSARMKPVIAAATTHRRMWGTPTVSAQALADVDERVGQRKALQPGDRRERRPRVVDGAEEGDRQHDRAEGEL